MGGGQQFGLDVDVDSLRASEHGWQMLAEHLATVSAATGRIPADIGADWTGPAATVMKAELAGLGAQSTRFAPMFYEAAMAVKRFADAAEMFQTQTVPLFNRKWDDAHAQARASFARADLVLDDHVRDAKALSNHEDGVQARAEASSRNGRARAEVATVQQYALASLESQFAELKAELALIAQATGDAMGELTVVVVPDSVAKDFIAGGGSAQFASWCNADGTRFPPDLGTADALPGMTLVKDMHDMADGQKAAAGFNDVFGTGPRSTEEISAYLKTLKGDSAAFRQAFLAGLDPKMLLHMQGLARQGLIGDATVEYDQVLTAVSQILAKASNARTQESYPVAGSIYDNLRAQYTSIYPPEQGYLMLAEVVQAGQNGQDTWDPALLADIAKQMVGFERGLLKLDPLLMLGGDLSSGIGQPTLAGRATALMLDAVGHNADASQDLLRGPDGTADLDLLHYLYDGRGAMIGDESAWGKTFGNVLEQASTHHRGAGGIGTRDYASAQIAADLVNYAGENPEQRTYPGMEQNIVDILTVHMDAVNQFAENRNNDPMSAGDLVDPGIRGDPLPWIRNTHANFDSGRLDSLMGTVFRSDYYAAKGTGQNPHPLLSQFVLAQQATWQQDVTYSAGHLTKVPGLLEGLAGRHGWSSNATIQAYTNAIHHEGGVEDASREDARAATDFVLGFGLDKIADKVPGGPGLGIPKLIAGGALERLKSAAIDKWLPEGDAAARNAGIGAEMQDHNTSTGAMAYLKWLDQPGHGPTEDSSYDSYATMHKEQLAFMTQATDGHWHIKDPGQMYLNRGTSDGKQAWEDFKDYYDNAGNYWLRKTDIWESFNTGVTDNNDALAAAKRLAEANQ